MGGGRYSLHHLQGLGGFRINYRDPTIKFHVAAQNRHPRELTGGQVAAGDGATTIGSNDRRSDGKESAQGLEAGGECGNR